MKGSTRNALILWGTFGVLFVLVAGYGPLRFPGSLSWGEGRASGPSEPDHGIERAIWVPIDLRLTPRAQLLALLGDPATSGLGHWPDIFDAPVTAHDLDGDGRPEIIGHSNDTHVYVYDAATGRVLATLETRYPDDGWFIERVLNEVAVGPLRPGAPPALVVANNAATLALWQVVPAEGGGAIALEKAWERRLDDCFWNPGMDAAAVIADVDGDGVREILAQTEETGLYVLTAEGEVLWHKCWAGGNAAPVVDDLDGDGGLEAIFASDSGFVSVFRAATGDPLWTFDAADPRYGVTPASIPVSPTVAELDGRPPKEVLFTARHVPNADPDAIPSFHMALFAVHQSHETWQPELLWMRQPDWAHPLSYTRLVVDDVDGDGEADVLGMDWNTPGHNPGNWERLGAAHAFRLTARGEDVWVRGIDSWWSNKDVLLVDLGRDGAPELLVPGAHEGSDGLWVLSADTGEPRGFVATWPWKVLRAPTILLDSPEGVLRLAIPVTPDRTDAARGAVLIIELRTHIRDPGGNLNAP